MLLSNLMHTLISDRVMLLGVCERNTYQFRDISGLTYS